MDIPDAIKEFRLLANQGATAVISGRSGVDAVVAWFIKEATLVLEDQALHSIHEPEGKK